MLIASPSLLLLKRSMFLGSEPTKKISLNLERYFQATTLATVIVNATDIPGTQCDKHVRSHSNAMYFNYFTSGATYLYIFMSNFTEKVDYL